MNLQCPPREEDSPLKAYQSLRHTRWDGKYHGVFIPKRRKNRVFGARRRHVGERRHALARHKESKIVPGHRMPDHIPMCIRIPPKYAVSNVMGYLKGKRAIQIARKYGGRSRHVTGEHFWARGYFVSTVGLDEAMVRAYIRNHEVKDERYEQMRLVE